MLQIYGGRFIVATSKQSSNEIGGSGVSDGTPFISWNPPSIFKYSLSILGK